MAAPALIQHSSAAHAANETVIKVGTLKLIIGMTPFLYAPVAEPGYRFDITVFDSPSDVTAAVATRSVDVAMVGYPVAVLAYSGGQPITVIGASTDGGFGIVAAAKSALQGIADLKGKRVAVQPASTVETLFRLRLQEEKIKMSEVSIVRLMFQDMPAALARGDIDAYVGIEPGPSISTLNSTGRIIDRPYHTPAGGLNLVLVSHPEVISSRPQDITAFLKTHRRAVEASWKQPELYEKASVAQLGVSPALAAMAMKNIKAQWQIDDAWMKEAVFYNGAMMDVKQIRQLPDMKKFVDTGPISAMMKA